ncbi:hypothetical protein B0H63DRAFT_495527 [Podospora didyma]|uniref:NAD-dependent epimerase/dehydratase domain-containing protein n=1 Tax=Podospora didyma TaxID=330526 RepID=A0AAE0KJ69_9PEZI|nr:hypothetical protein B0H63DRAFT_495527 [Podospora didyma]
MANKITLPDPVIPLGSLILVTGANGLNASHAADQLLAAGYRVPGSVRNLAKSTYLTSLFSSRNPAVQGVAGIVHVVEAIEMNAEGPDAAAAAELRWQAGLSEATRQAGTVKSFALTASAWGAWTPNASKKTVLTQESWNDEADALARDKTVPESQKGMAGFMALKTLVEPGMWDWVAREKPAIAFNSLLDTVMAEVLDPQHQGIPSTAGMVHMAPQWHIDCRDAGRLFVAVLASSPRVDRERIFGFGERYSWSKVAEILMKLYPEHEGMVALKDNGWDQTDVPNQRGEELLRRLGQNGWTSLEESGRKNAKSWLNWARPA